ncbi:unnamed protein product [Caenorhabditis sp. 36 PRJEB53466]|nr:unnamed protein product [Caenorhabditis sp. 36 PRJEB53466]
MTYGRYRTDVATLYDVFCEIGAPKAGEKLAPLRLQYPDDFHDPAIVKSIRQFAFPCQLREVEIDAVQLFSFVLTDSNSKFSFGFCRYTPRTDTCICFLSGFFWPNVFFKALNDISLVIGSAQKEDVESVLTKFYHTDIPNIDEYLRFADSNQKEGHNYRIVFAEKIPDHTRLPTLGTDKYFLEFYNAIDPRQMLAIFASLLKERRILFTGRKVSTLSSCLHAVSMLLYPMCWQSVFITILPESLIDMVMAPMPYLIGVPKTVLDNARLNVRDIGEVVIVDIDEKTLTSPFDDVAAMPPEVTAYLKHQLRGQSAMDDTFAKIFLRAIVFLFGDYTSGLTGETPETMKWSKERFLAQQRPSYLPYLSSLLGTDGVQYLERFIHDRLELLKEGHVPGDQFEMEIEEMDLKNRPREIVEPVVHTTMQSVKENASDVIGVLKTSGIQIANRLQRLTPREIRKAAAKKKANHNGFDHAPMSFDNLQWETTRSEEYDESPIEVARDKVPVANLIDFDEPATSSAGLTRADEEFLLRPADLPKSTRTSPSVPLEVVNVFADPFATSPDGPAPPLPLRPPPQLHPRISIPVPSHAPFPASGSSAPHLLNFQQGHQWSKMGATGQVVRNPNETDWYSPPPPPPPRPSSVGPSLSGQRTNAVFAVNPAPPPPLPARSKLLLVFTLQISRSRNMPSASAKRRRNASVARAAPDAQETLEAQEDGSADAGPEIVDPAQEGYRVGDLVVTADKYVVRLLKFKGGMKKMWEVFYLNHVQDKEAYKSQDTFVSLHSEDVIQFKGIYVQVKERALAEGKEKLRELQSDWGSRGGRKNAPYVERSAAAQRDILAAAPDGIDWTTPVAPINGNVGQIRSSVRNRAANRGVPQDRSRSPVTPINRRVGRMRSSGRSGIANRVTEDRSRSPIAPINGNIGIGNRVAQERSRSPVVRSPLPGECQEIGRVEEGLFARLQLQAERPTGLRRFTPAPVGPSANVWQAGLGQEDRFARFDSRQFGLDRSGEHSLAQAGPAAGSSGSFGWLSGIRDARKRGRSENDEEEAPVTRQPRITDNRIQNDGQTWGLMDYVKAPFNWLFGRKPQ